MLEGKIIKFYRENKGMTQSELGVGICSNTHLSKIERGLTEVSKDLIELLSNRLELDLKAEIESYAQSELLLKSWHEAIILRFDSKAKLLKEQLEEIPLLHIPKLYHQYLLILSRYYLSFGEADKAIPIIAEIENQLDDSPYNTNMLLHIKGILELHKGNYNNAIAILKRFDLSHYYNPEFYYHLAVAYHSINSKTLAYYYANKALQFFTEARSFSRIIDSEMLMLIQVEQDDFYNPESILSYKRLIEMADNYSLEHQRSMITHNYAYYLLRHGYFKDASELFKNALEGRNPLSENYIGSLEGYLNALSQHGESPRETLYELAKNGLKLAKKKKDTLFIHFFRMHLYKLQHRKEKYFHYLEAKVYPYLTETGLSLLTEHYQVQLFDHYMKKGDIEKANKFATPLVDKHRRVNMFV
ncbi:hypothetical protein CN692_11685 [Bacillus sp. AFS002410]|uniref:helix-turn-helix domain-containing protein n=1 Tax=Bacillus sp. AFS002410 TaxID=2033481 RepID=UPI000BF0DE6D|nr:helix-turn-helix transcriptional regulator [Bacillus sp. AFS002410]PEJ57742.1 hypothetical protein CN692_11685 [Bacillus sp. AFS002410]